MTDRTDFTKKPRTPGEKMREIENRLQRLERDFAEHIHHTINQDHVSGPVPAHPGGIGESAQRFHRDECWCNEPMPPGVAPRAENPSSDMSYLAAHADHLERRYKKEREASAPPAEPPGSPTVEEAEDTYEDQPRRECWEVATQTGQRFWFRTDTTAESVMYRDQDIGRRKYHLVELREWEGIYPKALIERLSSRVKELVSLVKALQRDNEHIIGENRGLRTLLDEHPNQGMRQSIDRLASERDQLQARVKELENNKDDLRQCSDTIETLESDRETLQAQVVSLQKRNAWLSDDVNAEIKKRVAAETKYREYRETVREKVGDLLAEATND